MTRSCDLTETTVLVGNKVSHSNHKTKRRFLPNLQNITLFSDTLGEKFSMRIAVRTLRTVDKYGGLDGFLLSTPNRKLSPEAKMLRKKVQKSLEEKSPETIKKNTKKVKSAKPSKRAAKKLAKKTTPAPKKEVAAKKKTETPKAKATTKKEVTTKKTTAEKK